MICLTVRSSRLWKRHAGAPAAAIGSASPAFPQGHCCARAAERTDSGRPRPQAHLAAGGFATDEMVNAIVRHRLDIELARADPGRLSADAGRRRIYFDRLMANLACSRPWPSICDVDAEVLVDRAVRSPSLPGVRTSLQPAHRSPDS